MGQVAKALGTILFFFESKKVGFLKIYGSKWNGGAPPHPFFCGGNSEMSLGVGLTDVHRLQLGSSHRE